MSQLKLALVVLSAAIGVGVSAQAPRGEIDRVAAFARLYGVVRYFYPSDAAASLDWNRVAVHGVAQVRAARDAAGLTTALRNLFASLGPGILIEPALPPPPAPGAADPTLIAWRYLGAAVVPSTGMGPYIAKRTNRPAVVATTIDGFITVLQSLPAAPLRGRTIRLRGRVRATVTSGGGGAAMFVRVDRPESRVGFFDNMGDRPVVQPEWREYTLQGPVADDATNLTFGPMASGSVTADFDRLSLDVQEPGGTWTEVSIADGGFESVDPGGWKRAGSSKTAVVTRPTDEAPEGRRYLRLAPAAAPASLRTSELFDAPPIAGAHVDVELGSGLRARVPITLSNADASATLSGLDALRTALSKVPLPAPTTDVSVRLADVVVAWNVFRHFYPYWAEAAVDWDAQLRGQLERAQAAATRQIHVDTMRRLVADVRDGHGAVIDNVSGINRASLPVRLSMIDDAIVVTASGAPSTLPVGAILVSIDGLPARDRLSAAMQLASGSTQWRQARGLLEIASCVRGATVQVVMDKGDGPAPATLACDAQPAIEQRPAPLSEVTPGVWYVDLSRVMNAQLTASLPQLAAAIGIVFDLRGYPTEAGAFILPHLIPTLEADRWMHVARISGPFGQHAGWNSMGWNLMPRAPRLTGTIMFLTDGRAISYAESVMAYIKDRSLGTIVGAPTAGANGNVVNFPVPGGITIAFTGMRVTGHDGTSPHHLIGVKPDLPMSPTLAGVRAGRDEVLDAAVRLIQNK